ncbi:MAG: N-acetyltransferase [Proteobacteria bacterium]|nr:MAG: N-acetyltransferase [Pseudomonadota bacterium]
MTFPPPVLESDRLLLTWPTAKQVDQYYSDIIGSSMFDTIAWDGPTCPNDMHDYWKTCVQVDPANFDESLSLAIIEKRTGSYIGGASLRVSEWDRTLLDIGFALAPKYHGCGYGTEAVEALVTEAFRARGAERVFANVFVENHASRRALEKSGFRLEGIQRRAHLKRDFWLDVWLLAITRPDWENR